MDEWTNSGNIYSTPCSTDAVWDVDTEANSGDLRTHGDHVLLWTKDRTKANNK